MTNQPKAEKNIFKEQIQTTICSGSRFQMKSVIYVGKVVAHSNPLIILSTLPHGGLCP